MIERFRSYLRNKLIKYLDVTPNYEMKTAFAETNVTLRMATTLGKRKNRRDSKRDLANSIANFLVEQDFFEVLSSYSGREPDWVVYRGELRVCVNHKSIV